MGHLSRKNPRFSAWIYRQRMIWNLLRQKFSEPANAFDRLPAVFYRWYASWFYAYSFTLARNHEYEADHIAAAITTPETLGRALIKLQLTGRFLSEVFWTRFLAAGLRKYLSRLIAHFFLLPRAFKIAEKERARQRWLTESLHRYAADDDTHPSLAYCLAGLGVSPHLPPPDTGSVGLTLLVYLLPYLLSINVMRCGAQRTSRTGASVTTKSERRAGRSRSTSNTLVAC